jgi:hypothetical protein
MSQARIGQIVWTDITVPNAQALRDFYAQVAGLNSQDIPVEDHTDYTLLDASGQPVVGVCHALGANATLPPQWLIYFSAADLDASIRQVEALGGKRLTPVREAGDTRFVVIEDPAGAVCALMQTAAA